MQLEELINHILNGYGIVIHMNEGTNRFTNEELKSKTLTWLINITHISNAIVIAPVKD